MSLPDVLRELVGLLPERVQLSEDEAAGWCMVRVQAERFWHTVFELTPTGYAPVFRCASAVLEAALREECEARGWDWLIQRHQGQHEAVVFLPPVETGVGRPITPEFIGKAPTPAEALALAVLAALKAEA